MSDTGEARTERCQCRHIMLCILIYVTRIRLRHNGIELGVFLSSFQSPLPRGTQSLASNSSCHNSLTEHESEAEAQHASRPADATCALDERPDTAPSLLSSVTFWVSPQVPCEWQSGRPSWKPTARGMMHLRKSCCVRLTPCDLCCRPRAM